MYMYVCYVYTVEPKCPTATALSVCLCTYVCTVHVQMITTDVHVHVYIHEKIRWTRAKRHTADSCFKLVGSHQYSPAQFILGSTRVYIRMIRPCDYREAFITQHTAIMVGKHSEQSADFKEKTELARTGFKSATSSLPGWHSTR